jgi:uncharacterized protein
VRRVLSVDGGGIRGLLPAVLLAALEGRENRLVGQLFDLVAGTSTGGIIACGAALGVPAAHMVALYHDRGGAIFDRSVFQNAESVFGAVGAKYDPEPLEHELGAVLGDRWLHDPVSAELLVPSYVCKLPAPSDEDGDGVAEQASSFFFKSWKARADSRVDFHLRDIARATSAAPTYFPAARIMNAKGETFVCVDGGVFANNPALCAWAAAKQLWPNDDIQVVSLGTGTKVLPIDAADWGALEWLPHIFSTFMDGAADTVSYVAQDILGPSFVRCEMAVASDVNDAFDCASHQNIEALSRMADVYTKRFLSLI